MKPKKDKSFLVLFFKKEQNLFGPESSGMEIDMIGTGLAYVAIPGILRKV